MVSDVYKEFGIWRKMESQDFLKTTSGTSRFTLKCARRDSYYCILMPNPSTGIAISLDHTFKFAKKATVSSKGEDKRLQPVAALLSMINEDGVIIGWVRSPDYKILT